MDETFVFSRRPIQEIELSLVDNERSRAAINGLTRRLVARRWRVRIWQEDRSIYVKLDGPTNPEVVAEIQLAVSYLRGHRLLLERFQELHNRSQFGITG